MTSSAYRVCRKWLRWTTSNAICVSSARRIANSREKMSRSPFVSANGLRKLPVIDIHTTKGSILVPIVDTATHPPGASDQITVPCFADASVFGFGAVFSDKWLLW